MDTAPTLRLAIVLILLSPFGALVSFLGPVCSTWASINAGTSKRDWLIPGGDVTATSVRKANKMSCRTSGNTNHQIISKLFNQVVMVCYNTYWV